MRLTTFLALLLSALAIAACGSDDPETDAPVGGADAPPPLPSRARSR